MKNVFLTGAGAPGAPGIIKALQSAGFKLWVGDCNPTASGRFLNEEFVQLPKADNPDFVSFLLNTCQQLGIEMLLPLVTKELLLLAEAKDQFKKVGVEIIVSNAEQLIIANNKGLLYQHLEKKQIPVPQFEVVDSTEALEEAVYNLGYPQRPVCIKPTVANGSRGVRILREDVDEFDLLFQHKPNHLYSNLPRVLEAIGDKTLPEILVSEYLPGEEFTVDTIVQDGIPKLILPRSRTKMVQGITTQGTFIKQEEIISYCDQILRSLHLSGPIGLQVKANEKGQFQLLEINPRLQGTSVAALGLGINLPVLAIKQAFEPIHLNPESIEWGTSFVRYYTEVFY